MLAAGSRSEEAWGALWAAVGLALEAQASPSVRARALLLGAASGPARM